MAEESEQIGIGCSISLIGIIIFIIGFIIGNEVMSPLGIVIACIGIITEALKAIMLNKNNNDLTEKKTHTDVVAELSTREFKEKKQKLQKELADKQMEVERLEKEIASADDLDNVDIKKILIREDQFEAIYDHLKETCDFIWGICQETEFQDYIGNNHQRQHICLIETAQRAIAECNNIQH